MSTEASGGPLAGLRVLELTRGRAGAIAGMLLADYGADVLRIEPPGGDPLWDELPGYPVWHRGKEIVEIDLDQAAAHEAIGKRLPVADVVLAGLAPRVLERAGLGPTEATRRAPRLVYTSISGFGHSVSEPPTAGFEALVQAHLGLPVYQGAHRATPELCTYPAASYGAGLLAVIGTLAALHQRNSTGRGQHVDTSLADGLLAQLLMTLVQPVGEVPREPPISGSAPTITIYPCGDGRHLQIHLGARGALDRLFAVTGLDASDYVHENTGRHFAGDPEAGERFRVALAQTLLEKPRDEWIRVLTEADVPVAPCLPAGDALDHPQTAALGMTCTYNDPILGRIEAVAPPIQFERTPGRVRGAALQRGMPRNPEAALRHTGWLTADEIAAAEQPRLGAHHGDASDGGEGAVAAEAEPPRERAAGGAAPLEGLRLLDFGMFAAGPLAAMLLAELGADVIKIEPPGGDTMRPNAHPFSGLHRGKRGIALDLKAPQAAPIVDSLLSKADVVLHNFRPGVAERLGLGWAELAPRHPGLIHVHSSGYGTTGPMAALPGFDQIYQAVCGMTGSQAGEGAPPQQVAGAPLDCLNAFLTAAGVLMALYHRDQTGDGQHVECAQLAAGLFALSEVYRTPSGITEPGRLDRDSQHLGFGYGLERAADGWVFVCCPDEESRDRLRELAPTGVDWSAQTTAECLELLARAEVPAARVRERFDGSVLDEPWLVASGRVAEIRDPALGRVRQPASFVRFSNARLPPARGGPALGEHTKDVLRELGLEAEVQALVDAGVALVGEPAR